MRTTLLFAILLATSFSLHAQDKKADPKKKAPPEPKTWMTKKGELLWEEKWDESEWPKDWNKGKGNWQIDNGQLKAAELPADAHHAYSSRKVTEINAVSSSRSNSTAPSGWAASSTGRSTCPACR